MPTTSTAGDATPHRRLSRGSRVLGPASVWQGRPSPWEMVREPRNETPVATPDLGSHGRVAPAVAGDESPACNHETHLRGFSAIPRMRDSYPQTDDSSSGRLYEGHESKRAVTNGSETVTGTINFEAFGQTAGTTGSSSSPYMPSGPHGYAGAWGYPESLRDDDGLMLVGAKGVGSKDGDLRSRALSALHGEGRLTWAGYSR